MSYNKMNQSHNLYDETNMMKSQHKDECLHFLDVNIFSENDKFATNVHGKKTFSGVNTNFKSLYLKHIKLA